MKSTINVKVKVKIIKKHPPGVWPCQPPAIWGRCCGEPMTGVLPPRGVPPMGVPPMGVVGLEPPHPPIPARLPTMIMYNEKNKIHKPNTVNE